MVTCRNRWCACDIPVVADCFAIGLASLGIARKKVERHTVECPLHCTAGALHQTVRCTGNGTAVGEQGGPVVETIARAIADPGSVVIKGVERKTGALSCAGLLDAVDQQREFDAAGGGEMAAEGGVSNYLRWHRPGE